MGEFGKVDVLISSLYPKFRFGSLDVQQVIGSPQELTSFLGRFPEHFVTTDRYVALKEVHADSQARNAQLQRSNEISVDKRVLNCTQMVYNRQHGAQVIDQILQLEQPVVAVDMEGVNLGAIKGSITLVQLAFSPAGEQQPMQVFIFDVKTSAFLLEELCRLFSSERVTKVFHGCTGDLGALHNYHRIEVRNVFDTLIASRHVDLNGKSNIYALYEHYTGEETNNLKKKIKRLYYSRPDLWAHRPLSETLTFYAAFDAYSLLKTFYAMQASFTAEMIAQVRQLSRKMSESILQPKK